MDNPQIWSVSDVNRAVREIVEGALLPFWMSGEIGSLTLHRSGHAYFTMKDAKSQLRAVYFGGAAVCTRLGVANGSLVEAFGNLTVYEVRGEYQFGIKQLRLAGVGGLQQRFEELRRKLAAEGLFDPEKKKPIPLLPRRIGVVTSPSGAAVRDFLQIINRRFPNVNVRIYPCAVQGAGAAEQVARGVEFFNRADGADVIVVTRGGGSMEDLWPFNEEVLARAVAASRIPVVSAVGHEIDFTICDFAADLRVPTPSAAAELVIGRREEMLRGLERSEKDMEFTGIKLLILPEEFDLQPALAEKLRRFVANGGKVLLTGRSAATSGLDFGAEFDGPGAFSPTYLLPAQTVCPGFIETPFVVRAANWNIRVTKGENLGDIYEPYFNREPGHFCSHQHTPNRPEPSGYSAGVIHDNTAALAHPLFAVYARDGAVALRQFLDKVLRRLLGDEITVDASLPSTARLTVTRDEINRRIIVHLLYADIVKRGRNTEVIEDLPPLYDTKLLLRIPETVRSVTMEPQHDGLPFRQSGGKVETVVPLFRCHQMIAFSF